MAFIRKIDTISHQPSFQQANCWHELKELTAESTLISPDYKAFINPLALRRLSTILRMGIATAKSVSDDQTYDAISYGTSWGCLTDTEKFLQVINTVSGDVFSPTAFIQSTHNTIAGQISLELKNHAYNMTHTQNTLSFEVALLDGLLQVAEGRKHVLVGAADEAIPFLERLRDKLIDTTLPFTSLATAIHISPSKTDAIAEIVSCETIHGKALDLTQIQTRLKHHGIESVDLVLESGTRFAAEFDNTTNFLNYSGYNQVASAFATHLGVDYLLANPSAQHVLILNYLSETNSSIILLKRV